MDKQKQPVSIYMPTSLILETRIVAAKQNMSRSAFVVKAVQRAIREISTGGGQQVSGGQQQQGGEK